VDTRKINRDIDADLYGNGLVGKIRKTYEQICFNNQVLARD
jgi:hypothetical protein